jgi:hypothetical protein
MNTLVYDSNLQETDEDDENDRVRKDREDDEEEERADLHEDYKRRKSKAQSHPEPVHKPRRLHKVNEVNEDVKYKKKK